MSHPRVRLTVRRIMAMVAAVSLVLGWVIHAQRDLAPDHEFGAVSFLMECFGLAVLLPVFGAIWYMLKVSRRETEYTAELRRVRVQEVCPWPSAKLDRSSP